MKTTTLSRELALKMYQGTDEQLKAFALENYPELGMKITDRVKTFQDACIVLGLTPSSDFFTNDWLRPHEAAQRKIETIIEALNEGWKPDWNDSSQYKYRPWFNMSSSGSGFSYDVCGFDYSYSFVGSRLHLKSRELAEYAGKQFVEIYKEMFTL